MCDSPLYDKSYTEDLTYGMPFMVPKKEIQIQIEIMTGGPVSAMFYIYEDFWTYKSGVYEHVAGRPKGGHGVRILGWGVEMDIPYWLCANSWGTYWGDNGFVKIRRGINHCGIESFVVAGLPILK